MNSLLVVTVLDNPQIEDLVDVHKCPCVAGFPIATIDSRMVRIIIIPNDDSDNQPSPSMLPPVTESWRCLDLRKCLQ